MKPLCRYDGKYEMPVVWRYVGEADKNLTAHSQLSVNMGLINKTHSY